MDEAIQGRYLIGMKPISFSMLTICGLEELPLHGSRGVTHVLSILDPDWPEPDAFRSYDRHHRTILRFHDEIEPAASITLPEESDVARILDFGRSLESSTCDDAERHLLVHCHAGISRSTAAMAMLIAQLHPDQDEDDILARLVAIRRKAWPNSRMIGFADKLLSRNGRLTDALARLYRRQMTVFPDIETFMRQNGRKREVEMASQALA